MSRQEDIRWLYEQGVRDGVKSQKRDLSEAELTKVIREWSERRDYLELLDEVRAAAAIEIRRSMKWWGRPDVSHWEHLPTCQCGDCS